ncbi:MAG: hypothetical protein Q7T18_04665 [Sedimentisphaerales bacterium]|nr:hypothetical protein [Sedimentisphaerales bacterium]
MHPLKTLVTGAIAVAALSAPAFAIEDNSLRLRLMESSSADSIYAIDEKTMLVTSTGPGQLAGELEGFCSKNGETLVRVDTKGAKMLAVKCGKLFEAESLEGRQVNGKMVFTVKSSVPEPFVFKNSAYPPIDRIAAPQDGRIPGSYSSLDLYQYMYALCKKDNGTPATVVTKRSGSMVRLTEAQDAEAFDYIFNSGDSRDPWYMECAGEKRFLVEKNYKYDLYQDNAYVFHANRGLDGINYVQLEPGKVASINSGVMFDKKERAEMARFLQTSGLKDFGGIFEDK